MTDYKALCAELTDELQGYASANPYHDSDELVDRARAALAEPEPPADGEVAEVVGWLRCQKGQIPGGYTEFDRRIDRAADLLEHLAEPELQGELIPDRYSGYQKTVYRDGFHAGYKHGLTCARAALDEPEPVPKGPTNQYIEALHHAVFASRLHGPPPNTSFEVDFARAVLARWGSQS